MKKILLTAAVLAFAGSAFAATVSGSVTTKYYLKDEYASGSDAKGVKFKSSGDVAFSGSKTSSNGLTFGGTYKVKIDNANETADEFDVNFTATTTNVSGVAGPTPVVNSVAVDGNLEEGTQTESEVSAFISGTFGKVQLGHHDSVAETMASAGTENLQSAITYTSPSFSGFSAGYTYSAYDEADSGTPRGFGIKYSGTFSGIDVGFGYGSEKAGDVKKSDGWKLDVGAMGFTVDYKTKKVDDVKSSGWSVKYAASNWDVKYSDDKDEADVKTTAISANYTMTEGLKLMIKDEKEGDNKTTYIGTKISF